MSTDPKSVMQSGLRWLEQVEMKVPGFQGYKEKELRRQSDRLLRESLARKVQDQRSRIGDAQNALLNAGKIEGLARLETANLKLGLLIDHLKTGASGYAGLFDAVKIKEAELDRVYQFDAQLAAGIEQLKGIIDQITMMAAQNQSPGPVAGGLLAVAEELNMAWSHRVDAMQGLL
ncbi:MAG: hypothetical protein HYR71_11050 [Chloroflexi bacterium]|nr:hypothetical protein [Chloroflexota bacterium]